MLTFLKRRPVQLGIQAGVLAAVIGSSVAYATIHKTVTLSVDGRSRTVSSFTGDVRGLLASQHLAVGSRDLVAPAPSSPLHDGETVVVRFGRPLNLTLNGKQHTYWTTALSVDQALNVIGVRLQDARMSASRSALISRSGLVMWLSTPKHVTLVADGRTRQVLTAAPDVAQFLSDARLTVSPADRLSAVPSTPIREGMVIRLDRVLHKRVSATEAVPFTVDRRPTSTLYRGQTKVLTPGRPGSRTVVYDLVVTGGKVTGKALVSRTPVTAPVTQVVAVGTRARPVPTSSSRPAASSGSTGGGTRAGSSLNWAALAQCESGGDPRAVSPAGYYGLYQFSLSTWHAQGGSGNPIDASPAEQTLRAQILYGKAGAGQWPVCGRKLFT